MISTLGGSRSPPAPDKINRASADTIKLPFKKLNSNLCEGALVDCIAGAPSIDKDDGTGNVLSGRSGRNAYMRKLNTPKDIVSSRSRDLRATEAQACTCSM